MRTKILALGLTLFFLASFMVFFASPALAAEEGSGGSSDLGPSPENGLTVAVGGVIGIFVFLGFILWRVLRKRKKQMMQM